MHRHRPGWGALTAGAVTALALGLTAPTALAAPAAAQQAAAAQADPTAWQNGAFQVDRSAVVHRSDVVLGRANTDPTGPAAAETPSPPCSESRPADATSPPR
ncbi:hypothetical protein [Streptomyces sp. NPDC006012]|uniref:hypothetical protein n=1 Tax=Streptomyces sp. NPDC006012 TaxID=3364739 RepID=UPI0036C9E7F5